MRSKATYLPAHWEARILASKIWSVIVGGKQVLDWFDGVPPNFHDAELLRLHLNRGEESLLEIEVMGPRRGIVTIYLRDWIDVQISGFSRQNVMGSLDFLDPGERKVQPWEIGVGLEPGTAFINIEPCYGAYGTIRGTISRASVSPAPTP